jgi:hypothetical protein
MWKERRWKAVALLATGMAAGVVIAGTPAGAHVASWTHNWNAHIKPKADKRYLPGGNLPRGRTLRGVYRVSSQGEGAGSGFGASAISFGYRLSSAPTVHFIPVGTPPPAACPGTAADPQAARGHLCVYEVVAVNVQSQSINNNVNNNPGASRYGASVLAQSAGSGGFTSSGTWAVKSP